MNRYTVTIQSAHYGTWDYSGQPEEYLIQDEEKSTIQILNFILNHLILNKFKIGSNYDYFDESISNYFEISYWNPVNWSETTIRIEKN